MKHANVAGKRGRSASSYNQLTIVMMSIERLIVPKSKSCHLSLPILCYGEGPIDSDALS